MFKKREKPRRDHTGKKLSQYGLFDIPTDIDTGLGNNIDDENDSDLEAELAALASDGGHKPPKRKPAKTIIPQHELDTMVADSMKDVGSDDDISVDENDSDLLGELSELTGGDVDDTESPPAQEVQSCTSAKDAVAILSERLNNYQTVENNAKAAGETSKARRYGRAIKTLKDLIKQAKSGKPINLNDDTIPPEITISEKKPQNDGENIPLAEPSRPAPSIPMDESPKHKPEIPQIVQENVKREKQGIDQELLEMLTERQKEYKVAALKAKKSGDAPTAIKFIKIAKQFDSVIAAVQGGQEVDLSKMPGPPDVSTGTHEPKIEENKMQNSSTPEITVPEEAQNLPEPTLITASSILEALEQRLGVYRQHETLAQQEGNSSKARRYGRIAKQFEQAIKLHKAGKPIPIDELPTPPGYGPIPVEGGASKTIPEIHKESPTTPSKNSDGDNEGTQSSSSPGTRISGHHISTNHAEKQVLILLAKQKQFKQAALNAKRLGEMSQAKEFLRQAKGFDKLLEAARAGLPVDWSSIPVSPEAKSQLDNEYDIVMAEECSEDSTSDFDVLARLENQLQKQLKMCLTTRDHNKALGDVAGTNRFERLALNVTKDLDVIRMARKTSGFKVPKFHYEMKEFSIVKCFTDIMDNHMEVTIHRGINYQSENPKEIDTFVKLEFPFPQDTPFVEKTSTIKDTNNPGYNKTYVIPIQRNSRQCQRVFKRHGIKFEVYSRGGFFRGDTLIGTANVKLQPLETQCEIHDSFDLLEGRKKVGGKLEIQIKLRNPIVTQQVEQVQEKWLILDQ